MNMPEKRRRKEEDETEEREQEKLQHTLTGRQKAAILLVVLGTSQAAQVFRHLEDAEVEKIIASLAEVRTVTPTTQEQVLEEAISSAYRSGTAASGGITFAKKVLEEALGARKAADIINRIDVVMAKSTSFEVFHNINAAQLANVLAKEQPQTIALVLAHLPPFQAAQILASLPEENQNEVILRVAKMDKADPEVVAQIEAVLRKQVSTYKQTLRTVGGARAVASILNLINRSTEKRILESLKEKEWEIAEEVKKLMFVFEDLVLVEDRSMQRVLKEIDIKDVTVALKAASDEVKNKFFSNLSKRAVEMIQEELEYMGPVKLKTVEEAQQKIVNVVRTLDEQGEVLIAGRGGREDEVLV
jgi:flagellar motor switch protein FliG